jgi:hypothetical protein
MQPFDYRQQVVNPFEQALGSAMKGFQLGASIRDVQQQQLQAEEARRRQEELQAKIGGLMQKTNPTFRDYEEVAVLLPKDAAEGLRKNYELRSKESKDNAQKFSGQLVSALTSPDPNSRQRGINMLRQRAEAERNSGNNEEAEAYELHANIAETGPDGAKAVVNEVMVMGTATFGKDWAQGILSLGIGPQARLLSSDQDKIAAGLVGADGGALAGTFVMEPGKAPSLVPREESYRDLAPNEIKMRNLDPTKSWQINEKTNRVVQVGTEPSVVFQAPLIGAREKYYDTVGEETGKQDVAQVAAANKAIGDAIKIDTTLNQLYNSQAITGLGAEIFKNVERVKSLLGSKYAEGKVADTELLEALLGADVFPQIGALGIGARGLDTPAERDFLIKVMTGAITMNRDTIIRMTEIRRNVAKRAVDQYNERVDSGELDKYFEAAGRNKRRLELPEAPRPPEPSVPSSGVDEILRQLGVIP